MEDFLENPKKYVEEFLKNYSYDPQEEIKGYTNEITTENQEKEMDPRIVSEIGRQEEKIVTCMTTGTSKNFKIVSINTVLYTNGKYISLLELRKVYISGKIITYIGFVDKNKYYYCRDLTSKKENYKAVESLNSYPFYNLKIDLKKMKFYTEFI